MLFEVEYILSSYIAKPLLCHAEVRGYVPERRALQYVRILIHQMQVSLFCRIELQSVYFVVGLAYITAEFFQYKMVYLGVTVG